MSWHAAVLTPGLLFWARGCHVVCHLIPSVREEDGSFMLPSISSAARADAVAAAVAADVVQWRWCRRLCAGRTQLGVYHG